MSGLAIRYDDQNSDKGNLKNAQDASEDVKIIWKGKKIAKVVFPSGKEVVFEE